VPITTLAAAVEKRWSTALVAVHSLDPATSARIGSRQLHEARMHHYLTQASSKAKPNGGILKPVPLLQDTKLRLLN
jgi:hypothetical protein